MLCISDLCIPSGHPLESGKYTTTATSSFMLQSLTCCNSIPFNVQNRAQYTDKLCFPYFFASLHAIILSLGATKTFSSFTCRVHYILSHTCSLQLKTLAVLWHTGTFIQFFKCVIFTLFQVDRVFRKLDLNQDGVITIEEFLEACLKDDLVTRSLQMFDNDLWLTPEHVVSNKRHSKTLFSLIDLWIFREMMKPNII